MTDAMPAIDGAIRRKSVTLAEIERQHHLGWPDFHPEDYCHRCGFANITWYAPSPLWNAVMGYPNHADTWHGLVCMACFAEVAEAKGIVKGWRLSFATSGHPRRDRGWGLIAELPHRSADGRWFDWDVDLWRGPYGPDPLAVDGHAYTRRWRNRKGKRR